MVVIKQQKVLLALVATRGAVPVGCDLWLIWMSDAEADQETQSRAAFPYLIARLEELIAGGACREENGVSISLRVSRGHGGERTP